MNLLFFSSIIYSTCHEDLSKTKYNAVQNNNCIKIFMLYDLMILTFDKKKRIDKCD